jgi:hypothetical protein
MRRGYLDRARHLGRSTRARLPRASCRTRRAAASSSGKTSSRRRPRNPTRRRITRSSIETGWRSARPRRSKGATDRAS